MISRARHQTLPRVAPLWFALKSQLDVSTISHHKTQIYYSIELPRLRRT